VDPAAGRASPAAEVAQGSLEDPGAVRNTLLQLASQLGGAVFTAGLTLYLVRALGASEYGVYRLAYTIGTLVVFPAGLGLPWAIGRFLADHISDRDQLRSIFLLGLKLQVGAAFLAAAALFVLSGTGAKVFAEPRIGWPLRWIAISIAGQALYVYLTSAVTSVRRVSILLWMSLTESATQTIGSVVLVAVGAGAAGAAAGVAAGYSVGAAAGLYLMLRLLRRPRSRAIERVQLAMRTILRYAGAMFVVDFTWSAIAQVDVVLIGAVLTSTAVGSFSAVLQVLMPLAYLGNAVASGVAPRLTRGQGNPDVRGFFHGIRYLVLVQGLVLAPMVVWAYPLVHLLLGSGYRSSPAIMRVLAIQTFVSGPASLVSVGVTYLGEARRRVPVVLGTLGLGLIATYILVRTLGVVGAAIGDDAIMLVYVAAHIWICSRLVTLDVRRLRRSVGCTLLAAAAMAAVLLSAGTGHLPVARWIAGGVGGLVAYGVVLIATEELSVQEIRALWRTVGMRLGIRHVAAR
jgi:O-antigen/teichoic acid export membrane protein